MTNTMFSLLDYLNIKGDGTIFVFNFILLVLKRSVLYSASFTRVHSAGRSVPITFMDVWGEGVSGGLSKHSDQIKSRSTVRAQTLLLNFLKMLYLVNLFLKFNLKILRCYQSLILVEENLELNIWTTF